MQDWDWIKPDPQLGLDKKILIRSQDSTEFNESRNSQTNENHMKLKPQSKHLRTRVDYLIKCLQNQINSEKNGGDFPSNSTNNNNNNNVNQNSSSGRSKSAKKSRDRKKSAAVKEADLTNNPTRRTASKLKRKHHVTLDPAHKHHSSDSENSDSNAEPKVSN